MEQLKLSLLDDHTEIVSQLPDETIFAIGLMLSLPEINKLCQVSKQFKRVICDNQVFWSAKVLHDYGNVSIPQNVNWRSVFLRYGTTWSFGWNWKGNNVAKHDPKRVNNILTQQVSSGWAHTAMTDLNNNLWVSGSNHAGQLGLGVGSPPGCMIPQQVPSIKVRQVDCGWGHTAVIDFGGSIWTCGNNGRGQLGLGHTNNQYAFTQVPDIKNVRRVSCGYDHTAVIDSESNIWVCGGNASGQLGMGDNVNRSHFDQVLNMQAQLVKCGDELTAIINLANEVWIWGSFLHGRLGLGPDVEDCNTPQRIPNMQARHLSSGNTHTVIVDLEGNVWTTGLGHQGQLGLGTEIVESSSFRQVKEVKARQVSCGSANTAIIDLDNSLWIWGKISSEKLQFTPLLMTDKVVRQVACGSQCSVFTLYA